MTDEDKAALTLILLYGVLALIPLWSMVSEPLCSSNLFTEAVKTNQATWCFEFWLNRYQILLGAVVAVGAAFLAWKIGMLQIRATDENLLVARRQTAAAALETLLDRRSLVADGINIVGACKSTLNEYDFYTFKENLIQIRAQVSPSNRMQTAALLEHHLLGMSDHISGQPFGHFAAQLQAKLMEMDSFAQRPLITERIRAALRKQAAQVRQVEVGAEQILGEIGYLIQTARVIKLPPGVEIVRSLDLTNFNVGAFLERMHALITKVDTLEALAHRMTWTQVALLDQEHDSLNQLIEKTIAQIEGREWD